MTAVFEEFCGCIWHDEYVLLTAIRRCEVHQKEFDNRITPVIEGFIQARLAEQEALLEVEFVGPRVRDVVKEINNQLFFRRSRI